MRIPTRYLRVVLPSTADLPEPVTYLMEYFRYVCRFSAIWGSLEQYAAGELGIHVLQRRDLQVEHVSDNNRGRISGKSRKPSQ
jgi:hypothetical protein